MGEFDASFPKDRSAKARFCSQSSTTLPPLAGFFGASSVSSRRSRALTARRCAAVAAVTPAVERPRARRAAHSLEAPDGASSAAMNDDFPAPGIPTTTLRTLDWLDDLEDTRLVERHVARTTAKANEH